MPTLAETIAMTTPVSHLLRKARRLGIRDTGDMLALAATRGCHHYARNSEAQPSSVSRNELSDAELTMLLLLGENKYDPSAIRCAAQLARSPFIDPVKLGRLAVMEKCERVVAHIARAGIEHDPQGFQFWNQLLQQISSPKARSEPDLPHWSRFVSMPGIQRSGSAVTRWLSPNP